jgi:hypothetical protein
MIDGFWVDIQAMPAEDLFWCLLAGSAAFAAEFAVKYRLFPRVGMDRRWALAFGVSSGSFVFGLMCEPEFMWLIFLSYLIIIPGRKIFEERFRESRLYRKEFFGSLSYEPLFFSMPVFGFMASCIELFSFADWSKRLLYDGEVGSAYPTNTMFYSLIILGTVFFLLYVFGVIW